MTTLITGAAGFIGSHLLERMCLRGGRIVAIDNFDDFYPEGIKRENINASLLNDNVKLYETDIRDFKACREIFEAERIDVVIHLAAKAGVRPSLEDPLLYEDVNCSGTLTLLELAREYRVRKFIFGSSSSVYGNNDKQPFSEEDNADNPISPYGATKRTCELYCRTYHILHGLSVTCLRFFTVYGPRQRPDLAIHKFARLITNNEPIPLFGNGASKRDYTFYSDIVDGIMASLKLDGGFEIINLGNSNPVELRQLISTLERSLDTTAIIEEMPDQPGDVRLTYADISKANRLLGYTPRFNFDEGIDIFTKWFRGVYGQGLAQRKL